VSQHMGDSVSEGGSAGDSVEEEVTAGDWEPEGSEVVPSAQVAG
jgi:hypothetical protein